MMFPWNKNIPRSYLKKLHFHNLYFLADVTFSTLYLTIFPEKADQKCFSGMWLTPSLFNLLFLSRINLLQVLRCNLKYFQYVFIPRFDYFIRFCYYNHWVKSVRIRSYSGPYFPAFGLNTERYSVSLRIQSKYGKIWTRITPNTDSFQAVYRFGYLYNTDL